MKRTVAAIVFALMAMGRAADRATTIVNGDLADGTGAALRRANVRFVNDRIVAVGDVKPQAGDVVIDAQGAGRRARLHRHPQSFRRRVWRTIPRPKPRSPRASRPWSSGPTATRRGRSATTLAERRSAPSTVNVAVVRRPRDRPAPGDEGRLQASRARRRNRADGAAGRSGDARRRGRAVERPRVRGRRLRRDERAGRAREGRRPLRRRLHVAHPRRGRQELRRAERGDCDRRRRPCRGADLPHQARHRQRLAQGGRGGRAHRRGARSAAWTSPRTSYPYNAWQLDDHGARAGQAVRLPAERREGARRRRRRGERADRPARRRTPSTSSRRSTRSRQEPQASRRSTYSSRS